MEENLPGGAFTCRLKSSFEAGNHTVSSPNHSNPLRHNGFNELDQRMSHARHWVPELLLTRSYLHVDYRVIKLSFAVNNIS
jgi:hypothetical protein